MTTLASFSPGNSLRRSCSRESIYSIQGHETDLVRDTTDTEWNSEGEGVEYEPVTDIDDDGVIEDTSGFSDVSRDNLICHNCWLVVTAGLAAQQEQEGSVRQNTCINCGRSVRRIRSHLLRTDTDRESLIKTIIMEWIQPRENDIITTKVIEVSMGDDGELQLADSEQTALDSSDSELDYHDYWLCANCRADNNDPTYRYCQKCFKVRKNFFPPRPKRKHKRMTVPDVPPILSQDSGIELISQDLAHTEPAESDINLKNRASRKRRNSSVDSNNKRAKLDESASETESDLDIDDVKPLLKSVSDPAVTIDIDLKSKNIDKTETGDKDINEKDTCITCLSEPKSGVFVHGRIAHICCCYKCAVKVWRKSKRCPVCNSKVSNVLRAVVM